MIFSVLESFLQKFQVIGGVRTLGDRLVDWPVSIRNLPDRRTTSVAVPRVEIRGHSVFTRLLLCKLAGFIVENTYDTKSSLDIFLVRNAG